MAQLQFIVIKINGGRLLIYEIHMTGKVFKILLFILVKVQSKSFIVSLRDFPQKLLNIHNFALWGKLAAAEFSPCKRSVRTHK